MCEQFNIEPDPAKMPLEASVFPSEVQVAFFVFDLLPDRWDGMSGMYMGKDWSSMEFLLNLYQIDERRDTVLFAKMYETILVNARAAELQKQRKEEERKAKAQAGSKTRKING